MLFSGLGALVKMKDRDGAYLVVGLDSRAQMAVLLSATDWQVEKCVPYASIEPVAQDATCGLRAEAAD